MNIFLINHYAGSPKMGMEYRPYYLAKEWIKQGHTVTILAATFSHLRHINPVFEAEITEQNIDNINYIWIKTPKYQGNGVARTKNMFSFIRKTLYKSSFFAKKYQPDIVIASSTYPSDNYVARKIAKLSKAKYIYEVHDLWPLSPMELGGMSQYHPFIIAMQHAENFAYRKADAIISMLPKTKKYMESHGLDLSKWHYIPNGVVVKDWKIKFDLPIKLKDKIKKLKDNNNTIIAYTGGHAKSNSLHTLVSAAKIISNNKKVHFLFVGDGIEKEKLIEQAKGLKNISFFDSIPKKAIPSLLNMIDIAVVGAVYSPLYKYGVSPNKLFDYMMSQVPVIQYIEAGNDIISKAKAGYSIKFGDPQAIVDAINKMISLDKSELIKMGKNGHRFVLENHNYSILAKKFETIMLNL